MCPWSKAMTTSAFVGKQNPDCSLALAYVSADESRCQATGSNSLLLLFFHYLHFSPSSKGNTRGPKPLHPSPNKYMSPCVRQVWHQLLEDEVVGKKNIFSFLSFGLLLAVCCLDLSCKANSIPPAPTSNFVDESINRAQVPSLPYVGHVWMSCSRFYLPAALAVLRTFSEKCVQKYAKNKQVVQSPFTRRL